LLALPDRPTAIFAASDTQAMGVLEAARDAGVRVPNDLSVIGYDDIEIAEYLGLTTMSQKLYQSGKRGVECCSGAGESRRPAGDRSDAAPVDRP